MNDRYAWLTNGISNSYGQTVAIVRDFKFQQY